VSNYFQTNRNVELSTLDYFEGEFSNKWSDITIVKNFTKAYEKPLPVVCISLISQSTDRLEIGNTRLSNRYLLNFDIFAKSDGQRIDLAGFILSKLASSWTYYIYSHSSSSSSDYLSKTEDGKIFVEEFIANEKINYIDSEDVKDQYRHIITVAVRKNGWN